MCKLNIGDKILFSNKYPANHHLTDVILNHVYVIQGHYYGHLYFVDGTGDKNFAADPNSGTGIPTLVNNHDMLE